MIGAGMTIFRRRLQETGKEMCFEATRMALDSAGLSIGDVILSLGGTTITDPYDLRRVLRPDRVGQRLVVSVWRADQPRDLEVVVAERPPRA